MTRGYERRQAATGDLIGLEQPALFSLEVFAATLTRMEFEAFFKAELPNVIRHLMYVGACFEEAADAAQTAFIAMWPRWEQIKAPKAYVRVAARNAYHRTAFGEYSANRTIPLADGFDTTEQLPQLCAAEFSEQEAAVVALIASLPPMQQLVMAWAYDGFTPTEIAEHLQVDAVTVRQNLFKARQRLKKRIDDGGAS